MRSLARAGLCWSSTVLVLAAMGCTESEPQNAEKPLSAVEAGTLDGAAADSGSNPPAQEPDAAAADSGRNASVRKPDAAVQMPSPGADASSQPKEACIYTPPPPLVMSTSSGDRQGTQGSLCIGTPGCRICGDTLLTVVGKYTVVHPGDEVVFSMPKGTLAHESLLTYDHCQGDKEASKNIRFHEDQPWTVSLTPGTYILSISAEFTSDDGSAGGTSASFGLIVGPERDRGPAEPNLEADCNSTPERDTDAGM
jgi:hypothetical protein